VAKVDNAIVVVAPHGATEDKDVAIQLRSHSVGQAGQRFHEVFVSAHPLLRCHLVADDSSYGGQQALRIATPDD